MASLQTNEITSIKSTFEDQIKVIADIGEFTNVVTFQSRDLDLQCKFQLLGDYPESPPTIIVRSQLLDNDQTGDIVSELQTLATSKLGTGMLSDLIKHCLNLVADLGVDLSTTATKPKSKYGNQKQKHRKKKAPKSEKEELPKGKKPPMKTAAEVIKRLQWDEAVDKEEFIVGYMDRLTGLEERAFIDFTWEDLATVDPYCLAIPQHRIQYFKYRDVKVWDKNERLDNVFGSTGSKLTLPDTIHRYHNPDQEREQDDDNEAANGNGDSSDNSESEQKKLLDLKIEVTETGTEHSVKSVADGKDVVSDKAKETSSHNKSKHRFNHFVAFQVTNKALVDQLVKLQREILVNNPDFEPYKIPQNGFHLTLDVMGLDSEAEIINCVSAMKKMQNDFLLLTKKADSISFEGVDHFSNRVIYAKVKFNKAFLELVDTIKYNLTAGNVRSECKPSFTPHLTLFNMKWKDHCGWRRLGKHVILPKVNMKLGHQSVDNISVCRMGTLADDGDFYQKVYEFKLSDFDFEL